MFRSTTTKSVAAALLLLAASAAHANYITTVTMNTAAFESDTGGGNVFTIAMQLTDGSNGDGVNNNTATITNFVVNGGNLTSGTTTRTGSATGDLSSKLTMTDSSTFTSINENFTPGSSLSFTLDLTTNVSTSENPFSGSGAPDGFGFTIFDTNTNSQGNSDITYNSLTGNFLDISIDGPSPTVTPSGGSIGSGPNAPFIDPPSVAPEPSSLALVLSGLAAMGAARLRRWRLV